MHTDVFAAIAEPTRRAILRILAAESMPVEALSRRFPVSRPAISRHLRVLRRAGLVREQKRGRARFYHLEAGPLRDVSEWVAFFDRFWQEKLVALKQHVEEHP
jgi:DNA-binding transcriptional ArsR family regulator